MSGNAGIGLAFILVVSGLFALFRDRVPPPPPLVIGVDIGTTFSCAAYFRPGNGSVEVVPNRNAPFGPLVPSIFYVNDPSLLPDGNLTSVLVGSAAVAVDTTKRDSTRYLFDLKRLIGRKYDTATAEEVREYPFTVVEGPGGYSAVQFATDGRVISTVLPETVTSHLAAELLANARAALNNKGLHRAVIAVPVEFDETQRAATVLAATHGGLTVERVLSEPTAAAMAYGLHNVPRNSYVVVYDMGGGTLDVALLSVDSGIFRTWSVAGDNHLGGESINDRFVADLAGAFGIALPARAPVAAQSAAAAAPAGQDPAVTTDSPLVASDSALIALRRAAESAKIMLSQHAAVEITIGLIPDATAASTGSAAAAGSASSAARKDAGAGRVVSVTATVTPAECPAGDVECDAVEATTDAIAAAYAAAAGAHCDGDSEADPTASSAEVDARRRLLAPRLRQAVAATARAAWPKRVVVTRADLERAVGALGAALAVPIANVLHDAEVPWEQVDAIALVGGSTRMPLVRAVVRAYFCSRLPLDTSVPPEQAVAIGAAVQGGVVMNSWPLPAVAVEDWEQLNELRKRRR